MFKRLAKHWLGFQHLKRKCDASLNAQELIREKKLMGARISYPSTVKIDGLPQVKYTRVGLVKG